jgi:23S rRNA (adenine2503-C2)-methyltransferase
VASGGGILARDVRNVVFMGMGEPLVNMRAVEASVDVLAEEVGIARRRITVSTSGVAPMMPRVGALGVRLALSLHAANDTLRERLMGDVARRWPITALQTSLRASIDAAAAAGHKHRATRRVSLEWVLLPGVHDGQEDADQVNAFARSVGAERVHLNVIPFNPWPGSPYTGGSVEQARQFAKLVADRGLLATVRIPRGRRILAACGQLKDLHAKSSAKHRKSLYQNV